MSLPDIESLLIEEAYDFLNWRLYLHMLRVSSILCVRHLLWFHLLYHGKQREPKNFSKARD